MRRCWLKNKTTEGVIDLITTTTKVAVDSTANRVEVTAGVTVDLMTVAEAAMTIMAVDITKRADVVALIEAAINTMTVAGALIDPDAIVQSMVAKAGMIDSAIALGAPFVVARLNRVVAAPLLPAQPEETVTDIAVAHARVPHIVHIRKRRRIRKRKILRRILPGKLTSSWMMWHTILKSVDMTSARGLPSSCSLSSAFNDVP